MLGSHSHPTHGTGHTEEKVRGFQADLCKGSLFVDPTPLLDGAASATDGSSRQINDTEYQWVRKMLIIWLETPLGLKDTRKWTEFILFVKSKYSLKKCTHMRATHQCMYVSHNWLLRFPTCFPLIFNKYHKNIPDKATSSAKTKRANTVASANDSFLKVVHR